MDAIEKMMDKLEALLQESATQHRHLCPRQVLGVRMGLLGGRLLGLEVPQAHKSKRLLTIVETDGCGADGISVATNCWLGRRTLRIEDFGKVAATFVDTRTKESIRIVPAPDIRQAAYAYAPEAANKWQAMLLGYQRMPDEVLLQAQRVSLNMAVEKLVSRPGTKTICHHCREEIINEREIAVAGQILCRACSGQSYYHLHENCWPRREQVMFVAQIRDTYHA